MQRSKVFSLFTLALYCFASSILSHNAAMHVSHEDNAHSSTNHEESTTQGCCEDPSSTEKKSCFQKCFGEFTKIFSSKFEFPLSKHNVYIQPYYAIQSIYICPSLALGAYIYAPPERGKSFLSIYIGTTKLTLYG